MRKVQRQRHVIVSLVAGITKHETLVPRSLFLFLSSVNASAYIRRLLVNSRKNATRIRFEHIGRFGVSNPFNDRTSDFLDIEIDLGFYLPGEHHLASRHKCLDRHPRTGIPSEEVVDK